MKPSETRLGALGNEGVQSQKPPMLVALERWTPYSEPPHRSVAMFARLAIVALILGVTTPAIAQDVPEPPVGDEIPAVVIDPDLLLGSQPVAVQEAAQTWAEAWERTPRLVSLQAQEETTDLVTQLEDRLKLLGEKTFSNREWKTYWEVQSTTSAALSAALTAAGASTLVEPLGRWTALADGKVRNQDAFFGAIQTERDALEDRLEAALQSASDEAIEVAAPMEDPNPYERRRARLDELDRTIADQQSRRALVASEVTFIERILESEDILAVALATDLELAETELSIARELSSDAGAWGRLWTTIADRTAIKVDTLSGELDYAQARKRSREVELGLAQSKIAFRDGRIDVLKAEHAEESSWASFAQATWRTLAQWLRTELWRIVLGLLAITIGVRFALRMVDRAGGVILARTDDDPDVDDDSDQRRETLADVFTGVVRITIFVIGGLLALEQIGINTGPLLGSVAILGLAISFGSQNLVRDVVNGFFILLENQFAVGDVVTIGGETGTVERITIRSTWVRSYNGDLHAIPNGTITKSSNLTRGWSRTVAEIGIGYGADIDKAEQVINRVGQEIFADPVWKEHLREAPAFVGVTSLGDSSVVLRMAVMVSAGSQWGVQRELYRRTKVAFDAEGIEIPFPQMVISGPGMPLVES